MVTSNIHMITYNSVFHCIGCQIGTETILPPVCKMASILALVVARIYYTTTGVFILKQSMPAFQGSYLVGVNLKVIEANGGIVPLCCQSDISFGP